MDSVFMIVLAMVFIAVFSFLSIFYPEQLWKLEHIFDVKNGEPTEWYITTSRLRGILFFLIDVVIILVLIYNNFG